MNKHLLILGIAVMLICVGLSGCTETNQNTSNKSDDDFEKFIGTWKSGEKIITLFNDKTCIYHGKNCTWDIREVAAGEERLVIEYPYDERTTTAEFYAYGFSFYDTRLTLTTGRSISTATSRVYSKQIEIP